MKHKRGQRYKVYDVCIVAAAAANPYICYKDHMILLMTNFIKLYFQGHYRSDLSKNSLFMSQCVWEQTNMFSKFGNSLYTLTHRNWLWVSVYLVPSDLYHLKEVKVHALEQLLLETKRNISNIHNNNVICSVNHQMNKQRSNCWGIIW